MKLALGSATVAVLLGAGLALTLQACQDNGMRPVATPAALGGATAASAVLAAAAAMPAAVPYHANPYGGKAVELSSVAQLGRKLFYDTSLSASGKLACASCHSPAHAYGPPDSLAVQLGGVHGNDQGQRAVPSLRYLDHNPNFSIGPNSVLPDSDVAAGPPPAPTDQTKVAAVAKAASLQAAAEALVPQGGFDWDGRADTMQEQADGPLTDPHEMGNRDNQALLAKLRRLPYANDFKQLFGPGVFDQPGLAVAEALFALGRYQAEEPSFHPYDSKYDYYLAGQVQLSPQEMRGLKLFEDPAKGNCSSCHLDKPSADGVFPPAFTDTQFEALGVPRNPAIKANRNPHYYDLGLCGPTRKDYASHTEYCGLFKTPTLRNVATRHVFFHNGVFHSLDDVLQWYVTRDTDPQRWYPVLPDGTVDKYNDLPPRYRNNVDVIDAPFDRKLGDRPALDDAEIADVIAFLGTLTDGYVLGCQPALTASAGASSVTAPRAPRCSG